METADMVKKKFLYSVLLLVWMIPFSFSIAGAKTIDVIRINDPITPVISEYIIKSIEESERAGSECIIIKLDTPGGLDLAMRDIIKAIMSARIPVVVYVSPSGARAASAGALITLASHVAAMAPGTNIGAAAPVSLGGGEMSDDMAEKIASDAAAYSESIAKQRNRNTEWAIKAVRESISTGADEALELNVIDLVAPDINTLVERIHGMEVELVFGKIELDTENAFLNFKEMGMRENILKALANPNIAYILFLLGLAGLYFEFSSPGAIFPGVIGGISLILAFYSMQTLSANFAGILLLLLGGVLFLLELKIVSYGLLTVAGIASLTIGSLMLFDPSVPFMRLSLSVIIPSVAFISLFFIVVMTLVVKSHRSQPATGVEGLVGFTGKAYTDISESGGKVHVYGEYWDAVSPEPIPKDSKVVVKKVNKGMVLTVEKG